jgi:hypothetical protein
MTETTFDAITVHAAALSRRTSLIGLGGAALAISSAARARKGKKNASKKKCKEQGGQCASSLVTFCADRLNPENCLKQLSPCCEHFKTCDAAAAIDCLFFVPK